MMYRESLTVEIDGVSYNVELERVLYQYLCIYLKVDGSTDSGKKQIESWLSFRTKNAGKSWRELRSAVITLVVEHLTRDEIVAQGNSDALKSMFG